MSQPPTIECKPNGPLLVKGLSELRNSRGAALPTEPVVALCRCGDSANKPFCDGSHRHNGFSGAKSEAAPAPRRRDFRAPGITIHDDRSLCAHAARCTEGLAAVFKYGSKPWIDPAGADVAAVVEVIRRCPSGALSYTLDGPEPPRPPVAPSVLVTKNGPYEVTGAIALTDATNNLGNTTPSYTLCRCGASKNKPFCDGSHASSGFTDDRN
jgi:CDGSH-type Zn-finger protein